jgi:hypothetical protein
MNASFLYSLVGRQARRLKGLLSGIRPAVKNEWKNIEHFDESWKGRIRDMARHVPPHSVVLDLGCGKEWLREFLIDCKYIPVDYQPRSAETVVCDFNRDEFPDAQADVCFVSGCLEYIERPDWFVGEIAAHAPRCVISYCTVESFPDRKDRDALGWKNAMNRLEVVTLFENKGMRLEREETSMRNTVFCFARG